MSKSTRKKPIRDIPAYQEYASDVLANLNWRMMSLAERGLWDTLRKECWVNGSIPSDSSEMAVLLNKPVQEIKANLTKLVLGSFLEKDGRIFCTELDLYKADRLEIRRLQSEGGALGGLTTQAKIKKMGLSDHIFEAEKILQANLKVLSRHEQNGEDMSSIELSPKKEITSEHKEWLEAYDQAH